MQSRNQALALAVAVLFAVALVLVVVVISLFIARTGPEPVTEAPTAEAAPVLADPEEQTDPAPTTDDAPAGEEPPPTLLYESLGDGTCAVLGPGTLRDAFLIIPEVSPAGETVAAIGAGAFRGCGEIEAVRVPATVRRIGALAFADCPRLSWISVAADNPDYRDEGGVLFSADRTVLIQYPPMRRGDPAVIPASVTAICEMAFYRCADLRAVRYEGTGEDWDRIAIAPRNHSLVAAAVEFAGT